MDRLADLPEKNTIHTAEESEVMNHFFGDVSTIDDKSTSTLESFKNLSLKKIVAITGAFVLFVNPVTSACFSKLPYCNGLGGMTIKTILFVMLLVLILLYL